MRESKVQRLVSELLEWFDESARDLPWRRTRDPYAIWVSEIMLQQTQVKTVIPFWERWMRELPTIKALARATPERLHKLWEGLGYYSRVRNLQKAARTIMEDHAGEFPREFDRVLELPGIGRYTAGAICSIAFNQPTPILDGNVMRVLSRIFGVRGDPRAKQTNERLWSLAAQLVTTALASGGFKSNAACSHLNQSLMELGALICAPRNPNCALCPVQRDCFAAQHALVDKIPSPRQRAPTTRRRFVAFVVEHNDRFLARQRAHGAVNASFWEFPNVEVSQTRPGGDSADTIAKTAENELGFAAPELRPMCAIRHSITRYRITVEVFRGKLTRRKKPADGLRWLSAAEINRLAFTAAHRKIARLI